MELTIVQSKIIELRGSRVMLDYHLAELYGVSTKVLNQAVKRNIERFPLDFMFQLTENEALNLRSQFVTSSLGGRRYRPYAFTEHGVAMLSGVLRSPVAIQVNIAVVRAFILLKQFNNDLKTLQDHVLILEKHFNKKIIGIHQIIELLLAEKKSEVYPKRGKLGFELPQ